MQNRILTGETIDGVLLGEWLEDAGRASRYAIEIPDIGHDSIWVCSECEHVVEECDCFDYDEPDVDELTEWMDFDPDC